MLGRTHRAVAVASTVACLVSAPALAGDRFVSTVGVDVSNDCASAATPCRSVTHAASQAASGDVVKVASGNYVENVRMESSTVLEFLGGWDAQFTTRDPVGAPSVLKAGHVHTPTFNGKDRVWTVFAEYDATIALTIDGFVIRNGKAGTGLPEEMNVVFGHGRAGGGLLALALDDSTLTIVMRNTIVTKNRDYYGGAGLSLWAADASSLDVTLDNVQVVGNRALLGAGGGILAFVPPYLADPSAPPSTVGLHLVNCVVAGNRSWSVGSGVLASNYWVPNAVVTVDIVSSTITRNLVRDRSTGVSTSRGGAGLYVVGGGGPVPVTLTDSIVWGNLFRGFDLDGADVWENTTSTPSTASFDVAYSDLGDVAVGPSSFHDLGGNLSVDPLLSKDAHLLPTSPVRDVGTCAGAPANDIDGDARPTGSGCDIGADEIAP